MYLQRLSAYQILILLELRSWYKVALLKMMRFLRAMEEYVGREVIRAPYPGIMGAIGVGLIAKEQYEKNPKEVSTWDLRDLDTFSYEQQANAPCPFCTNHCQRTIVQFFKWKFLGNK